MRRIFIYGSCGSRDAFELERAANFQVVDYFARSSIASAFSGAPAQDRWSQKLQSSFQKRQVRRDFVKTLPNALAGAEFDLLLVDLIDERFRLFQFNTGALVTISAELQGLGVLGPDLGRVIRADAGERFELWRRGWDKMAEGLAAGGRLDRLIVNRLFWAPTGIATHDDARDATNAGLRRMYDHCALSLSPSQFIDYDPGLLVADPGHRWGPAPFHYCEPLYQETLRQLAAVQVFDPRL